MAVLLDISAAKLYPKCDTGRIRGPRAMIEKITDEQLQAKLKEILEEWPLYRRFEYRGGETVFYLPAQISSLCDNEKCKKEQLWQKDREGRRR